MGPDAGYRIQEAVVAIEALSEHPFARAIVNFFSGEGKVGSHVIPVTPSGVVTGFESITGKGVKAFYNGDLYHVGSRSYVVGEGCRVPADFEPDEQKFRRQAQSVVCISCNRSVVAMVALSDVIRPGAAAAIGKLQRQGLQVHLLSGDSVAITAHIAAEAGIGHFRAEATPAEKTDYVRRLKSQGFTVAMVGDGINDSPALAGAAMAFSSVSVVSNSLRLKSKRI